MHGSVASPPLSSLRRESKGGSGPVSDGVMAPPRLGIPVAVIEIDIAAMAVPEARVNHMVDERLMHRRALAGGRGGFRGRDECGACRNRDDRRHDCSFQHVNAPSMRFEQQARYLPAA